MLHGIFTEDEVSLLAMFSRAIAVGAFAVAERIVHQVNWPGQLYIPPLVTIKPPELCEHGQPGYCDICATHAALVEQAKLPWGMG